MLTDPHKPLNDKQTPPKIHWQGSATHSAKLAQFESRPRLTTGSSNRFSEPPQNLGWDNISWGDIQDAFNIIKHQLFPFINKSHNVFEAVDLRSNELKEHCFSFISLKSFDEAKPPGVFGKIRSFFPEHATIKNLHQAEMLIPNRTQPLGIRKIGPGDVDVSGVIKNWYLHVPIWCNNDEEHKAFTNANIVDFFHRDGLHPTSSINSQPIAQYVSLRKHEKDIQPWIYVISSNWLSTLQIPVYNAVIANLRFLLEKRNRIIINYVSHPTILLNTACDLQQGRDKVLFIEARTPEDVKDKVKKAFDSLFRFHLNSLIA